MNPFLVLPFTRYAQPDLDRSRNNQGLRSIPSIQL